MTYTLEDDVFYLLRIVYNFFHSIKFIENSGKIL